MGHGTWHITSCSKTKQSVSTTPSQHKKQLSNVTFFLQTKVPAFVVNMQFSITFRFLWIAFAVCSYATNEHGEAKTAKAVNKRQGERKAVTYRYRDGRIRGGDQVEPTQSSNSPKRTSQEEKEEEESPDELEQESETSSHTYTYRDGRPRESKTLPQKASLPATVPATSTFRQRPVTTKKAVMNVFRRPTKPAWRQRPAWKTRVGGKGKKSSYYKMSSKHKKSKKKSDRTRPLYHQY